MKDYYLENAIKTASPAKLVEMLYERAIELLKEAKAAIEQKDYVLSNEKISKVQEIITELNVSLDMEKGGEIAQSLRALYNYMYKTLIEANLKKDIQKLDEVLYFVEQLLDAWKVAMKTAKPPSIQDRQNHGLNISI
ncbi:flagellar protein FliS [Pseudothermotoga thermarum DSM 5069]|uniref:Flagellar secretion chaperone FliS n=2 Tax=Pseudothermotoga thermarum TaxID=119394 RepID=F7YXH0_9THEM|nr:flagellar protein FliS [Pseudothermotoga thermarum DSM 5069]